MDKQNVLYLYDGKISNLIKKNKLKKKKKEVLTHTTIRDSKKIMLSERNQMQTTSYTIPFI